MVDAAMASCSVMLRDLPLKAILVLKEQFQAIMLIMRPHAGMKCG